MLSFSQQKWVKRSQDDYLTQIGGLVWLSAGLRKNGHFLEFSKNLSKNDKIFSDFWQCRYN